MTEFAAVRQMALPRQPLCTKIIPGIVRDGYGREIMPDTACCGFLANHDGPCAFVEYAVVNYPQKTP